MLARNPAAVASGAAFAVTLGFVSANALWFQPHVHPQALFSTRAALGESVEPQPRAVRPALKPDPILQSVQASLEELGFEVGAVDGLDGPATRTEISEFQQLSGLEPTGRIDEALLIALDEARGGTTPAPAAPSPEHTGEIGEPAETSDGAPDIRKLQAGLRAFGNGEIEVDGIMGAKTRNGIAKFQAMFGLPETGEPDPAVFAKMSEIGLTD
jgi:peptidoglycan hydrolase-like protein with peptidoglycan-binding domain